MIPCSNHKKGFSLVEVAIAMTVAAFMIIALFNLQGMLFKVASNNVRVFNQLVHMKNFFYAMMRKELPGLDDAIEEQIDNDTMTYILHVPHEKSAFKKIENVARLEIDYNPLQGRSQRLVSFVYYPEEKEKPEAHA